MSEGAPGSRGFTWMSLVAPFVGGAAFGVVAKLADESAITGASDLGTYLGLWVVVTTLVAAWSRSPQLAAVRVAIFMLTMVVAYYLVAWWMFGILPVGYVLAWGAAAFLLSPPFALLTWPSRRQGWLPGIAAALPIGILLAEAFSFRWVLPLHLTQFVFDLGAAVFLFAVLPRGAGQRMRVLAFVPLAFLAAWALQRALPYILAIIH